MARDAQIPEHRLGERPPGASVPVDERVDGLELRVGDRDVRDDGEIGAARERDQIIDGAGNARVLLRAVMGV